MSRPVSPKYRIADAMNQLRAVGVKAVLAQAGEALSKASGDVIRFDDAEIISKP